MPVGSGLQIKTIPLAKPNQFFVTFDEDVTGVSPSAFQLRSAITGAIYPVQSATFNSSTKVATVTLSQPITDADQLTFKVFDAIKDNANNRLDGEWSPNPTSVRSFSGDTFDSGNDQPGGTFEFNFVVLPGDLDRDNSGEGADFLLWQQMYDPTGTTNTFSDGDFDGDGDVDGDDLDIWEDSFGINFRQFP